LPSSEKATGKAGGLHLDFFGDQRFIPALFSFQGGAALGYLAFLAHTPEFVFIRGCFAFKERLQGETTAGSLCFQFALTLVIYSYGNSNRARFKHSARVDPIGKSEETLLRRR
jgi:hypothetical protein